MFKRSAVWSPKEPKLLFKVHWALVVRVTIVGRTPLYCYSVITVGTGCIPFFKWDEMVEEGGYFKKSVASRIRILAVGVVVLLDRHHHDPNRKNFGLIKNHFSIISRGKFRNF